MRSRPISDEHFTVDGTRMGQPEKLSGVDAAESDPPEDPGNPTVNFHGERRRNDTHQSTTDPEAMLHRKGKGKEAKLAGQGLVANVCATHATGTAERDAAVLLLEASASPGSTVGADKGYDVARFVADVRVQDVTPQSAGVRSTSDHAACGLSRESAETKTRGTGLRLDEDRRRPAQAGIIALVDWQLTFAATAYNLVRLRNDSVSPCAPRGGRDTRGSSATC